MEGYCARAEAHDLIRERCQMTWRENRSAFGFAIFQDDGRRYRERRKVEPGLWMALLLALCPVMAAAQNTVRWTTNYYAVTGGTLSEIRQSMRQNRPWKERIEVDGMTDWKVTWQFGVTATANGCRCN